MAARASQAAAACDGARESEERTSGDPGAKAKASKRPVRFKEEIARAICEKIACGWTLSRIEREPGFPTRMTIWAWSRDREEFGEQLKEARRFAADSAFDDALDIANDGRNDTQVDDSGRVLVDHDHIRRSQLRVDVLLKRAAQLAPEAYAPRSAVSVSVTDGLAADLDARWKAALATEAALKSARNGEAQQH